MKRFLVLAMVVLVLTLMVNSVSAAPVTGDVIPTDGVSGDIIINPTYAVTPLDTVQGDIRINPDHAVTPLDTVQGDIRINPSHAVTPLDTVQGDIKINPSHAVTPDTGTVETPPPEVKN